MPALSMIPSDAIVMVCGVQSAEQRFRVINRRSRQDERELAWPETVDGSVANAVGKLLRNPAQRRVHRLAVDALRELVEPFEADHEHGERLTVTMRLRDFTAERVQGVAPKRLRSPAVEIARRRGFGEVPLRRAGPSFWRQGCVDARLQRLDWLVGRHSTCPTAIVVGLWPSARFASSRRRAVRTCAPDSLVSGIRIANSRSPRLHEMSLFRVTRLRSRATWSTLSLPPSSSLSRCR